MIIMVHFLEKEPLEFLLLDLDVLYQKEWLMTLLLSFSVIHLHVIIAFIMQTKLDKAALKMTLFLVKRLI